MSPLTSLLLAAPAAFVMLVLDLRWEHRRARVPHRPRIAVAHHDPASPSAVPGAGLTVSVLGPVQVFRDGATVHLSPKALELVAYLGCHPSGVTEDQISAALWPDRPPRRSSFNNLVSLARSGLGDIDGGPALLPVGADRRYRLHPAVEVDLTLLGSDAVTALGAVRGRPFDANRGFDWAHREGLESWAAAQVAKAAHETASARLAAGDPSGAQDAAERGLRAAPGEDVLFRDRMLAYAAEQNPAGVERVMSELCAYFEVDDPTQVAHPATLEVHRRYAPEHARRIGDRT